MVLPVAAILVEPSHVEERIFRVSLRVSEGVAAQNLFRDFLEADPADPGISPGEVPLDYLLVQPQRFEDLGTVVTLQGGNAHLGEHLQQSLVQRLDVVLDGLGHLSLGGVPQLRVLPHQRFESQVGIDGGRPEAGQEREVVHLPRLAGFHDQPHVAPRAVADQVVVHRSRRQQAGDGGVIPIHPTVGEDDEAVAAPHRLVGFAIEVFQSLFQAGSPLGSAKQHGERLGLEVPHAHVAELFQLVIGKDVPGNPQHQRVDRLLVQQVPLPPQEGDQRHHRILPDGVNGRVGDLGEILLEVAEQQLGFVRQHRDRRIHPHGAHRLLARFRHGSEQNPDILFGVPENLLAPQQGLPVRLLHVGGLRQFL